MTRIKTRVAIVGAGPSGLLLGQLLGRCGIDNVIVERVSPDHVLGRIRAGILESGFTDLVRKAGAGERMDREGQIHRGFTVSIAGQPTRIDLAGLTGGRAVFCYGQVEVTRDLMALRASAGQATFYESTDVRIHNPGDGLAGLTFLHDGREHQIESDFIAGCDGFHGVCRPSIPSDALTR